MVAQFVEDVTVPDGTVFNCGEQFTKIWNAVNTGEHLWPKGTMLVQIGGKIMMEAGHEPPLVTIGKRFKKVGIAADMVAPPQPGHYRSKWRLMTQTGIYFGDLLWCDIVVKDPETKSETTQQPAGDIKKLPKNR